MDYQRVEGDREYVARLEHGGAWRGQIEAFAAEKGIDAALFSGHGAVSDATVLYYIQDETEYAPVGFDAHLEREHDEITDSNPWAV